MKAMLLVMHERKAQLDRLYDSIASQFDKCDIFKLTEDQQENLGYFFKHNNPKNYDRVVIFSRIKRLYKQSRTLRFINGLVFIEYDACQNYMHKNKNHGKFTKLYLKIPGCRVVCSGYTVSQKLISEGVDAKFVPKGFDETAIYNQNIRRDIFSAFIGSTKHQSYTLRRKTLAAINEKFPVLITQTASGESYTETLNRVRVFVSADSGMSEYMLKNFESMAAGCVLMTEDQGEDENRAVGFKDMVNVVLYKTPAEAANKLEQLKNSPELCDAIAQKGQQLVAENFTFGRLGKLIAQEIQAPMHYSEPGFLDRLVVKTTRPWLL